MLVPEVAPLHRDGSLWPRADEADGFSSERARADKETTYPELVVRNPFGKLVVVACETDGRWKDEGILLVAQLGKIRVAKFPPILQHLGGIGLQPSMVVLIISGPYHGGPMPLGQPRAGHASIGWAGASLVRSPSGHER